MLEQLIEFESRKLQQVACLVMRQRARAVALDRERLKRLPTGIRSLRNTSGSSTVIFMVLE